MGRAAVALVLDVRPAAIPAACPAAVPRMPGGGASDAESSWSCNRIRRMLLFPAAQGGDTYIYDVNP